MMRKFFSLLKVYDVPQYTKIRLGNKSDGGYVVLKELAEKSRRLNSYGVGNDVSFELDMVALNPNCSVYLFDPTIDTLPQSHLNFAFFKMALTPGRLIPVENTTLKMDIEWGEWDVFEAEDDETISAYDQIIAEFHAIPVLYGETFHTPYFTEFHKSVYQSINSAMFRKYAEIMEKLLRHYHIFHIHANNSLMPQSVYGMTYPPLLEISFVNKKHVKKAVRATSIGAGLDFPNKPHKPEIRLGDYLNV